MQQKTFLILTGLTLAAVAAAAVSLRSKNSAVTEIEDKVLFPGLVDHVNDVAELTIEKAGKTATLRKADGRWTLSDRGGYPADLAKVKELALRVAGLEIEETKTAKKANHAQLGVEWPPKEAEEGAEPSEIQPGLVTLKDASGKELASVVVGKSEWRGSKPKVFVRKASEDQVYLCGMRGSGSLEAMPEAKNWIDPKFIELTNDRVQTVTIDHPDGEKVVLARSAANHTQFTLQDLAPGEAERYQGVANGVAQALGYGLQLDDVRPVAEVDFTKEPLATTTFRTVDGLVLTFQTSKFEDKDWVKVSATYEPPPEPPAEEKAAEEPKPEGEASADAANPAEEKKDVGKEAAELGQRLAPWAFAVPSYKSDVLTRHRKDLLAEPAPAGGEEGVNPTDDGSLQGLIDDLGVTDQELTLPVEPPPKADDEGAPAPAQPK